MKNNNPEPNFMSPLRTTTSAPPIKKQRGGSTPGKTGSTTGNGSIRSRVGASVLGVAPPPTSLDVAADEAIARRRAELRRLQRARSNRPSTTTSKSTAASVQPKAATSTSAATSTAAPSAPPVVVNRSTDKHPPTAPPSSLGSASASGAPQGVLNQKATTGGPRTAPPPPRVNRRLEFPNSAPLSSSLLLSTSSSSSSVPSRHPPPPPNKESSTSPTEPQPKNAPESTTKTTTTTPAAAPPPPAPPAHTTTTTTTITDNDFQETSLSSSATRLPPTATTTTTAPPTSTSTTPGPIKPLTMMTQQTPFASTAKTPTPEETTTTTTMKTTTTTNAENGHQEDKNPPSTVRRDRMRSLRQNLDTPRKVGEETDATHTTATSTQKTQASSSTSRSESKTTRRLKEAYAKAEQEKQEAFRQIKELEEKLLRASSNSDNSTTSMQQLLQVAEDEGGDAALKWARDIVGGYSPLPASPMNGFLGFTGSPGKPTRVNLLLSPDTPVRRRVSQRTLTPHPKHASKNDNGGNDTMELERLEKQHLIHFQEAASCVPYEYTSKLATFCVRRPYGLSAAEEEEEALFRRIGSMPPDEYQRRAHVSDLSTLEVIVVIHADNSLLLLFDKAGVRYPSSSSSSSSLNNSNDDTNDNTEFQTILNVDHLDRPLGTVGYIDKEANDLYYSLDEILEEALLVREQYCSTMISTALGWKDRPKQIVQVPVENSASADSMPPQPMKEEEKEQQQPPSKPANAMKLDETSSSSTSGDVTAVFLGMIFESIFGLVYWFLVTLPLKTVSTAIVLVLSFCVVGLTGLYLMEDTFGGDELSRLIVPTTNNYNNAPGVF